MGKAIEMVGRRFGKWTVLSRAENRRNKRYFLCRCVCGLEKCISGDSLRMGESTQCKFCASKHLLQGIHSTHRMTKTDMYYIWSGMKDRCYNINYPNYRNYGGRGIIVCDEWKNDFIQFLKDMGNRPSPKHSLDRINTNGNYEPGNCRWATSSEQQNNRRNNIKWKFNGETKTIAEWAKKFGIHRTVLLERIKRGWPVEKALTTPVKHKRTGKITYLCSPQAAQTL